MSYVHRKEYPLRYADFDFQDILKPSALLALTQESACLSADELGFGYEALKPRGIAFVIVSTYCKCYFPIKLGSALTVETWPLPPRHVIFERAYRVLADGELAAAVSSRWCLVDLNDFSLLRPDVMGETHENCPYRAEKSVEVPSWKIPKAEHPREVYRMRVESSHCDHYLHANNTRYADFFFDCFSMDELSRPIDSFQIVYGKQVREGKELVLCREDTEGRSVCEAYCDGELVTQFAVTFRDGGSEK